MVTDGSFSKLTVIDESDSTTEFEDVSFLQRGFNFTAFVNFDYYPLFDVGNQAIGYQDGTAIARGIIQDCAPSTRNGEQMLRITVTPNQHPKREYTIL